MVVSGLTKKNGNGHAEEIAKMALKLLALSNTFRIPHLPDGKIMLRIGLHSGNTNLGLYICRIISI